jgi:hypothetical protein
MIVETLMALAISSSTPLMAQNQPLLLPQKCPGKMLCPWLNPNQQLKPNSNRPYPAGTPCGPSLINGKTVFVNPQSIPGSYCDRDGTLQYK